MKTGFGAPMTIAYFWACSGMLPILAPAEQKQDNMPWGDIFEAAGRSNPNVFYEQWTRLTEAVTSYSNARLDRSWLFLLQFFDCHQWRNHGSWLIEFRAIEQRLESVFSNLKKNPNQVCRLLWKKVPWLVDNGDTVWRVTCAYDALTWKQNDRIVGWITLCFYLFYFLFIFYCIIHIVL